VRHFQFAWEAHSDPGLSSWILEDEDEGTERIRKGRRDNEKWGERVLSADPGCGGAITVGCLQH